MPISHADRLQAALWIALALACAWLLAMLGPILAPFLLAAILAYIGSPLVDRLVRAGLPRLAGVLVVLLGLVGLAVGLGLILVPLLFEEAGLLANSLPNALALANEKLLPWLQQNFGVRLRLDPASLRKILGENMDTVQALLAKLYESARIGGSVLLGLVATLVLVPVVMFYLLVDWHALLARIEAAIPRRWHGKSVALARQVDGVLAEYLRGQLMVMALLAAYYGIALWLVGLPQAWSIGLLTGLLIFIPYLGFASGLALALLVAALQFQGWGPIVAVLAVFGVGQVLESFLLTPYLVGDRIGLHPLAVIFALLAFGQLFGFFGVLLALPASAALLVALREVRTQYLASRFYREGE